MLIYVRDSFRPRRKSKRLKGQVARKYRPKFKEIELPVQSPFRSAVHPTAIPSIGAMPIASSHATPLEYEGEMAKREEAAKKESERRKKMLAPMYSKGPYQYIGDAPPEIVKGLGRKL